MDAPEPRPPPPAAGKPPVPGRGSPAVDYALSRVRASPVLKVCLVAAFLSYGGLALLLALGRFPDREGAVGSGFVYAATMVGMSLLSWTFLFLWFPGLRRLQEGSARDGRRAWLAPLLEDVGVACVAVVHFLLAATVLILAVG